MKIKNSVYLICLTALLCAESLAMSEENQKNVEKGAIRVLIVDGFGNHYWEQTTRLVRDILDSSGLFNIDVSTTPATKEAEGWDTWRPHFSNYDVVIQSCNSLGGGPIWPREVESDLEAFVSQGGGLYKRLDNRH